MFRVYSNDKSKNFMLNFFRYLKNDLLNDNFTFLKGLVGDVGSLKKKRSLTPDVLKVSEASFQIFFVTTSHDFDLSK